MNKNYILTDLENRAYNYIKENIVTYGLSLSKLLLEKINFEERKVLTYLPQEISLEDSNEFIDGIFLNPKQTYPLIIEYLLNKIEKTEIINICVFEDRMFKTNDDFEIKPDKNVKFLFHNDEVYPFNYKKNIRNIKDLEDIIFSSFRVFPPSFGIFSKTTRTNIQNKEQVDEFFLEEIAKNTQIICIQAYDNDSCLIWEKNE